MLEIYESDIYQETFPNIQKISPVKDPAEVDRLNGILVEALGGQIGDIALTIPDIIDYRDATCCVFSNGNDRSQIFPDIDLGGLYEFAAANEFDLSQLENIKTTKVTITDVDGRPYRSHSLMRCLVYDHEEPSESVMYHLSDGDWYKVQQDYVEEIVEYLDGKFVENDLPEYDHDILDKGKMVYSEGAYNEDVPPHLMPAVCLDQTSIAPAGYTGVEPCDIYRCTEEEGTRSGSRATFYHVKISTRSSQLSHLFNQGVNAVELVSRSSEAAERLLALVKERGGWGDGDAPCQAIAQRDFSVVFGIITRKEAAQRSANIPLFSKISLKRNLEYLWLLRVPSFYTFIPDNSPEKNGHVKYATVEVILREVDGSRGLFASAGQHAFGAPVSTELPVERARADWKTQPLGTHFQISVVRSKTGHLRTYHGWPFTQL
ncbi:MAG: hypothetical protein EVA34_02085 [Erythrobacter sp.]|nr:MAG: hypothetical protein EVA34_02085 [Erythrobacter sp.]